MSHSQLVQIRENPNKEARIKIGVSSCLLGHRVRYDGGHRYDPFLTHTWGRYLQWVAVCPEVEMGMGVPREMIRLVGCSGKLCLIGQKSGYDYTSQMQNWAAMRVQELDTIDISGFILKKRSPSCGIAGVQIYDKNNNPCRKGPGMFVQYLVRKFPWLPVEDEIRLRDPGVRENFIERVVAYRRLRNLMASHPRLKDVTHFHDVHKLSLLSHGRSHDQKMKQFLAQAENLPSKKLVRRYADLFMKVFHYRATPRRHARVLNGILKSLQNGIDERDKQELLTVIENYLKGYVPLIVPITLIKHHLLHYPVPELNGQTYLNPCFEEVMLKR